MVHRYTKEEQEIIERIAKKNKIKPVSIKYRLLRNGYDFSKIDYPSKEKRIKYLYKGRPAVDVARENGISKTKFTARIVNLGWSVKKACTYNEPSFKEVMLKTGYSEKYILKLMYDGKYTRKQILENYKK